MRFSVWLEVQVHLVSRQKDAEFACDDARSQAERILDHIEARIREMGIGEPLYLQVSDIKFEGDE